MGNDIRLKSKNYEWNQQSIVKSPKVKFNPLAKLIKQSKFLKMERESEQVTENKIRKSSPQVKVKENVY